MGKNNDGPYTEQAIKQYLDKKSTEIDELAIGQLSTLIDKWAKTYGKQFNKHIKFNNSEIDIELRIIKPEIERKLVD